MLISRQEVWDFVQKWQDTFDHIDMSFFEITTMMALDWFAAQQVDVVVLETGLGGRLDSTNIVSPALCVITNIGLDHCDMLGETLPEIAFEKAGIIKPNVPVVVGESHPDIDAVFERKVLYTNLPEPMFMGNRTAIMSLLVFADKVSPSLWDDRDEILAGMDLRGDYQRKNLRTVLAALDVISGPMKPLGEIGLENVKEAIMATASRTGFHGRWEKVSDDPCVICDIGHNEHGLKYNFAQLENMKREGSCSELIVVYGSVADKDVDAVLHLMPSDATYIFTQAQGKRALPAQEACDRYLAFCAESGRIHVEPDVRSAVAKALAIARCAEEQDRELRPLIYIGGSTYVVSEAMEYLAEMKS
jgi:dihydrofolate synthase/folylpolyglutamate synthase